MMSKRISKAFQMASIAHVKQVRKGDCSPYFNHLLEVKCLLVEHGFDDECLLISALLHDALEDTSMTYEDVQETFGRDVAELVKSLSDDKESSLNSRRQARIDKAKNVGDSHKLIKLADAISNARLIPLDWSIERANDSMEHLLEIAKVCSGASLHLSRLLVETVEKSLQTHATFLQQTAMKIQKWMAQGKVFYSPNKDTFYFAEINVTGAGNGAVLTDKIDTYLRTLRSKNLHFSCEICSYVRQVTVWTEVADSVLEAPITDIQSELKNEPVLVECLAVELRDW
ncbi:HD domain-containing protein [Aliiglaciecola lipolytica]|uniref:HD domain-containing protein n=1 Tax=Aliiglaciecola lipolytica TaxID=477689 RepID=UPI001C09A1EF|nr:HD domain-containing protein [Aliiglaciecola lipolytica]MBU2877072.1 HD domain-containing protein [Aliiglaciecola lipolytica]